MDTLQQKQQQTHQDKDVIQYLIKGLKLSVSSFNINYEKDYTEDNKCKCENLINYFETIYKPYITGSSCYSKKARDVVLDEVERIIKLIKKIIRKYNKVIEELDGSVRLVELSLERLDIILDKYSNNDETLIPKEQENAFERFEYLLETMSSTC